MFPWQLLITGAVGVGGTALGAWLNGRTQTKTLRLSLDAENERARLARKRQMYTDCVTTFAEMITATSLHRSKYSLAEKNKKLWEPVEAQYQKAFDAMVRAEVILSLGAPRPVTKIALEVRRAFADYEEATRQGVSDGSGSTDDSNPGSAAPVGDHAGGRAALHAEVEVSVQFRPTMWTL
jgi:hypothetical protein